MRLVEPSDGEAIPPLRERMVNYYDNWAEYYQDTGEIRVVDSKTGGAKGSKRARFDLLPFDALWAAAEHFGAGGQKYEGKNMEADCIMPQARA